MDNSLAKSEVERQQKEGHMYHDHKAMRTTSTKVLEMFLDLSPLGMVVDAVALAAAYHLLRSNSTTAELVHNWIGGKSR